MKPVFVSQAGKPQRHAGNGSSLACIPLARPDIGPLEQAAVQQVLASGQLSRGPFVARFEQAMATLVGTSHAVALSSGTAGLIVALQALGVSAGAEVITVSYTVPATLNAIVAIGATPVLVDVEARTRGMDPEALAAAITPKTQAVIAVHAFGQAADLVAIKAICEQAAVPLLEDACEAPGNHLGGRSLGQWGQAGVFGFYPNKQVTTGEGGMLVTDDPKLAAKARMLRNNGRDMGNESGLDTTDGWLDQAIFGWNFRLDEMSAALGVVQLQRLPELLATRHQIAQWYEELLGEHLPQLCRPAFSSEEAGNAWFSYVVHVPEDRQTTAGSGFFGRQSQRMQRLVDSLQTRGIQCGRYFAPLHRQPAFEQRYGARHLPVTDELAATGLALPFYAGLTRQQVEYVVLSLRQALLQGRDQS